MVARSETAVHAVGRVVAATVFVVLPISVLAALLVHAYSDGVLGIDFEQTLLPAARKIADGDSPYPAYGYPPLVAYSLVPLTFLPAPNVVFTAVLVACVPAALWLFGVRDWRCYGVVFLWSPVLAAIQTGNVTLLLLLATAVCWYGRDRWRPAAISGGLAIAAKILCWPLVVWLASTRRFVAAVGAALVAAGVTLVLWGALGFSGFLRYPKDLNTLGQEVASESYTVKVMLTDIGVGSSAARLVAVCVAIAVLLAVVVVGRRGDDRRSFSLALAAMILASPIAWLHSFALLVGALAVMRPRFSLAWLMPVVMAVAIGTGTGNGSAGQTAAVIVLAALTMALALMPSGARPVQPRTEAA